jgi:hypothetical protein
MKAKVPDEQPSAKYSVPARTHTTRTSDGRVVKRQGKRRWSLRLESGSTAQLLTDAAELTRGDDDVTVAVRLVKSELQHLNTLPPQSAYVRNRRKLLQSMLQLAEKAR